MSGRRTTRDALDDILDDVRPAVECFALPHGMTGVAIADPGRAVTRLCQQEILAAIEPVASAAFGADMSPYWAQRRHDGYFDALREVDLVMDAAGRVVGWSGYRLLHGPTGDNVYLDATGLLPVHHGQGIMRSLFAQRVCGSTLAALWGARPSFLSARTESPIFFKLMRSLVAGGALFPHPDIVAPEDVLACGRHLAAELRQSHLLEPRSLLLRGSYGVVDALYGEPPTCGDPRLDALFRDQLGSLDAYLVIGRIDGRDAR